MFNSRWIGVLLGAAAMSTAATGFAFDCPTAPAAIRDIKAQGYYEDRAGSIVDESKKRENEEMTRPLNDFVNQLAGMADRYQAEKDAAAADCALAWIDNWAQAGAMLGKMVHVNNDQSDYMRQWIHGGTAVVYLRLKAHATAEQRTHIEPWLKALSNANLAYWDNPKKSRNNHYYWTGIGIMATGVATDDKEILQKAAGIYQKGITDILDDGSLPMEMRRGQRAFHYHNYALAPLVLIAEMARIDGMDWYAYRDHRINLLAERVADGFHDNAWFAQQSGVPQEASKPGGDSGWVEFYRQRAPHPELFDNLHHAGPFKEPRMGGDLSLMARDGIVAQ